MQKTTKAISTEQAVSALMMIGNWDKYSGDIIVGNKDNELHLAFFYHFYRQAPETMEQAIQDYQTQNGVKDFKNFVHAQIELLLSNFSENERAFEKMQRKVTNEKFKEKDKPAPEGTVAELAERFNVSKKRIRSLKKEGRLNSLFES